MLSDREKEGCRTILNKLSEQDLLTLTDTVTNRVVSPENKGGKLNDMNITRTSNIHFFPSFNTQTTLQN